MLGTDEIPDEPALADLDDADTVLAWNLRPTLVVSRPREATRAWALRIFQDTAHDGSPRWDRVRWWFHHRAHPTVIALWNTGAEAPIWH